MYICGNFPQSIYFPLCICLAQVQDSEFKTDICGCYLVIKPYCPEKENIYTCWFKMPIENMNDKTPSAEHFETENNTLLNNNVDLEGSFPVNMNDSLNMASPARPLAEGNDIDSTNTSWDQVGSSMDSISYPVVEDEAGGNLTSGSGHTRADATAADIPPTSH